MFKEYKRTGLSEMTPYLDGMDMDGVSISDADKLNGSPKDGDMIARNPKNHNDKWLVAKKYFEDNFELAKNTEGQKTLGNTCSNGATKNVKDIVFWGNGDLFKLIAKASSQNEGWMKSTKAMQVGNHVVVQVTTQQRNLDGSYAVAEALTTVENAVICEKFESINGLNTDKVISRFIEPMGYMNKN